MSLRSKWESDMKEYSGENTTKNQTADDLGMGEEEFSDYKNFISDRELRKTDKPWVKKAVEKYGEDKVRYPEMWEIYKLEKGLKYKTGS